MSNDPILATTLQVLGQFHSKSVFLYGSRGRGDFKPDSDYELGIIFDDDKYVRRANIHAVITNPDIKAYPFKWGELSSGTLDILFQKSIYLREIIEGAKTIAGEDIIGQIQPPPITTLDLVQDIRFYIGRALDALLSYRSGDIETSMDAFSKSCFFGLRALEILKLKKFPVGYDTIYNLSAELVKDPEYREPIEAAYAVRKEGKKPEIDTLYQNISLLDSFIEPKILAAFKDGGDRQLI